jgi:hypothetical protein
VPICKTLQVGSEEADGPPNTPAEGLAESGARSGDGGGPPAIRPAGAGPGADALSAARLAQRELMRREPPGRTPWKKQVAWFALAALVGSMLAVVLSSFH